MLIAKIDIGGFLLGIIVGIVVRLYQLVSILINLIFIIASTDIFKEDVINEITSRVYIVLAIFMLFRITISCIQFLISPDKMDDKEAGFGAIIKRTAISVCLLALIPTIFAFAKQAQVYIIAQLPPIVLGKTASGEKDLTTAEGQDALAKEIGFNTFISFLQYKKGCDDGSVVGLNGVTEETVNKSGNNKVYLTDLESAYTHRYYIAGEDDAVSKDKCETSKDTKYDYNIILGLLGGGFLIFCLVCMVIDVGIRCIKWAILQIIAPIPIATYIDPKTSKKSFDAWKKNCIDVYCSLFINLTIIYLVLFFFQKAILNFDFKDVPEDYKGIVLAVLILSLFFFAKQAPKFLCDILGIKEGSGSFKEMFGRGTSAFGLGAAGISAFRGNYRNATKGKTDMSGRDRLKALASAAAGATSANANALSRIAKGQAKGFRDVKDNAVNHAMQARVNRTIDKLNGLSGPGGWAQRHEAKLDQKYQIKSDFELSEFQLKANNEIHTNVGNFKKAVMGRIEKEDTSISLTQSGCTKTLESVMQQFKNQAAVIDQAAIDGKIDRNSLLYKMAQASKGAVDVADLKHRMASAGIDLTYASLTGLAKDADTIPGLGELAQTFGTSGSATLMAQKEIFSSSMNGNVKDSAGNYVRDINVVFRDQTTGDVREPMDGEKKAHVDIANAVSAMEQTLTSHAADLTQIKVNGKNLSTPKDYSEAFRQDFSALDDAVQAKSASIQSNNADAQAKRQAALDSLKRRQANKDKK